MNVIKTCFASVVDGLQQSDIYLTIKARLLETPKANLNGVRVTDNFINEIVANQDKYVGIPLCADVQSLANGDYTRLGHLYDSETGEFHSSQIGSFYKFEKEEFDGGSYLVGYMRVMKRNKEICSAISELFATGNLKFSFEISCGSYVKLDDGTLQIDASENNFLEGVAVVSFPACEDAVALALVAECIEHGKDETTMEINESVQQEIVAEDTEVKEVVAEDAIAEEEHIEVSSECDCTEEKEDEKTEDKPEPEDAECKKERSEEEDAECKKKCAEEDGVVSVCEASNAATTIYDSRFEDIKNVIAELRKMISSMNEEINEVKNSIKQEEEHVEIAEFAGQSGVGIVDDISIPLPAKKYSLLESDSRCDKYTLLDRD